MLVSSIVNHKIVLSDGNVRVNIEPYAIVEISDGFSELAKQLDGLYLSVMRDAQNDGLQVTSKKRNSAKDRVETT